MAVNEESEEESGRVRAGQGCTGGGQVRDRGNDNGWYCYLESTLSFPFTANCIAKRSISPLKKGDEVEVINVAPSEECEHEMFVMIRWEKDGLAVPPAQRKPGSAAEDATRQAVEDWHYWVKRGYSF